MQVITISRTTYQRLGKYAQGLFRRTGTQLSGGKVAVPVSQDVYDRLEQMSIESGKSIDRCVLDAMNHWDKENS